MSGAHPYDGALHPQPGQEAKHQEMNERDQAWRQHDGSSSARP
ncbi:MAG: hypothetical protein ACTHLA_07885 [Asticcacaulis sp.]